MISSALGFKLDMLARKVGTLVTLLSLALGSSSGCMPRPPCSVADEKRVGAEPTVEYVPLAPPPRPISPRPVESVSVVVTPPTNPVVEIGLLEASQPVSICSDRTQVVAELRRVAALKGCDVVIIYGGNDTTEVHNLATVGYRATCGVYSAALPAGASTPTPARP